MDTEVSMPSEPPLETRRRALVIGASSGIGAALARKLAREGYKVILLARRKGLLESLQEEINANSNDQRAYSYTHDVGNLDEIPALFQRILKEMKRIDVCIYNAGVMPDVSGDEYTFEKDRQIILVNVLGAIAWLNQAALLFTRMGSGQIVGISSVAGDRGRVGKPVYHASKAALTTYLEALRNRLSRYGVNVLTVKPGVVATDLSGIPQESLMAISPEQAAKDIWRAMRRRKQVVYTPSRWRLIMYVIRSIPSFIFRRMSI